MGSPAEFQSPNVFEGGGSNGYNHGRPHSTQTKATIPGMTALASVAALLVRLVFKLYKICVNICINIIQITF